MKRSRPPGRTALLLIGHGSRVAAANRVVRRLVPGLNARFPRCIVEHCFFEAARPDIAAGVERCVGRGASRILFVPYFLFMGGHVKRDLPRAARRAVLRHPGLRIRIASHLGEDPRLLAIVCDRVRRGLGSSRWS